MAQHLRVISGSAGGRRLERAGGRRDPSDDGPGEGGDVLRARSRASVMLGAQGPRSLRGDRRARDRGALAGAARAVLVEHDRAALEMLRRNLSVTATAAAASVVVADVAPFSPAAPPERCAVRSRVLRSALRGRERGARRGDRSARPREWTAEEAIVVIERPAGAASPAHQRDEDRMGAGVRGYARVLPDHVTAGGVVRPAFRSKHRVDRSLPGFVRPGDPGAHRHHRTRHPVTSTRWSLR